MKLASLKSGRDGILVVVSRDLKRAIQVPGIAPTLQYARDNHAETWTALEEIYDCLNQDKLSASMDFNPGQATAPLPRAYQWADASAYVTHVELVRKARGAIMPVNFWTDPLMYQGASDDLLGPHDPISVVSEDYGIDFEAELAIITNDVPMAIKATDARKHILLFMLANDVSLRNLVPAELEKGFGFFQSKPATAFSPVAITPDELGAAFDGAKVHLPLLSYLNGSLFGAPNAGVDMTFGFDQLIAHAAKTRHLKAGTIMGSGTVSNQDESVGSSCIAEKRMRDKLNTGSIQTSFMRFNDTVRIEMLDKQGQSLFGAIEQKVQKYSLS